MDIINAPQRLISIGLPVFNGEKHLQQALDSLLRQTYRNFEVIICDNASTDRTEEICRFYCAKDSRVRYQRNIRNLGILANWRFALDSASGQYFMWAAHDDWWSPEYLNILLETLLSHPDAVLAAGRTIFVNESGELRQNMEPDRAPHEKPRGNVEAARELLLQHATNWLHGLFPRSTLLGLSSTFFKENPWGSDVLFLLELCLAHEIIGANKAIIYKRVAETQRGQPQTALDQVRWQAWFARALLRVILSSPLSLTQKAELFRIYLCYLKWLYVRRGFGPWIKLWAEAGYQSLRELRMSQRSHGVRL